MEKRLTGHDEQIELVFEYLKQLLSSPEEPRVMIGFTRHDEVAE